jgi:hypothetical protein
MVIEPDRVKGVALVNEMGVVEVSTQITPVPAKPVPIPPVTVVVSVAARSDGFTALQSPVPMAALTEI